MIKVLAIRHNFPFYIYISYIPLGVVGVVDGAGVVVVVDGGGGSGVVVVDGGGGSGVVDEA